MSDTFDYEELAAPDQEERQDKDYEPVKSELDLNPMAALLPMLQKAASVPFTADQQRLLTAPIDPDLLAIKPTGEIYLPQVQYRNILHKTFGVGGWALIPLGKPEVQGKRLQSHYALIAEGRWISEAIGGMDYIESNERATWDNCAEGAKSDALVRCCKDLGIAAECWDHRYVEGWKNEFAVSVWRKSQRNPQWRRRTDTAWYDETGVNEQNPTPQRQDARANPEVQPPTVPQNEAKTITVKEWQRIQIALKAANISDSTFVSYLNVRYGFEKASQITIEAFKYILLDIAERKI